jgi:hypothetical protein
MFQDRNDVPKWNARKPFFRCVLFGAASESYELRPEKNLRSESCLVIPVSC